MIRCDDDSFENHFKSLLVKDGYRAVVDYISSLQKIINSRNKQITELKKERDYLAWMENEKHIRR